MILTLYLSSSRPHGTRSTTKPSLSFYLLDSHFLLSESTKVTTTTTTTKMDIPNPNQEDNDSSTSTSQSISKIPNVLLDPQLYPNPQLHIRLTNRHSTSSSRFSSLSSGEHRYLLNHDFTSLSVNPTQSLFKMPKPSPMLLMCDPNVERELELIARKLIQKQRKGASITSKAPGPNLFVILPGTNDLDIDTSNGLIGGSNTFYLYFLCHYGAFDDQEPKLHICEDVSTTTSTTVSSLKFEPQSTAERENSIATCGYRLRNLDNFLSKYTISMLSLLCALQKNPDAYIPPITTTTTDPVGLSADNLETPSSILAGRIRTAIRFLATRAYEALQDFQENPSLKEEDLAYYESAIPDLHCDDLWDDNETMAASGVRVEDRTGLHEDPRSNDNGGNYDDNPDKNSMTLGAGVLYKTYDTSRKGGIHWLCQAHDDVRRSAPATEQLNTFVRKHKGSYLPIKKSCSIRLMTRKYAQAFYKVVSGSQHLKSLKISLAWNRDADGIGVTEEDLWELCEVVHTLNLQELSLDCGCDYPIGLPLESDHDAAEVVLSFRPIMGIICRKGLEALTVENFDGNIFPGGSPIQVEGELDSFSLQQFRYSESLIVPKNISLKRIALCHWTRYPDITGLTSVVVVCPNLSEIESLTSSMEKLFFSIQNATGNLNKLIYFNMYESDVETVEITIWRLECGRPALRKTHRRSCKPLSPFIQSLLGLQNWTATKCIRVWEQPEQFHNVIHNNIGSLKSIDMACVTERLVDVWPMFLHELMDAEAIAAAAALTRGDSTAIEERNKHVVSLRLDDLMGHCIESTCSQRLEKSSLVIKSYEDSFRPYLQPLSQYASILSIDGQFTDAQQLVSLLETVYVDGLWFNELAWFLTPETLNDPVFMAALQDLVRHPEVEKLTIRINGGEGTRRGGSVLNQIQMLLQTWNNLTGMSLGWIEYGRWMQEIAVQSEYPFSETLLLPTGAGELTFAAEDVIVIGSPLLTRSGFPDSTWSMFSKASFRNDNVGSVVYALSCRSI